MAKEIEMNDLLGHTEDTMSAAEEGDRHPEKTGPSVKQGPTRMNRYRILILLVCLVGALAFFVIDRVDMSHDKMFDSEEKESESPNHKEDHHKEDHKDEIVTRKPPHGKASKNSAGGDGDGKHQDSKAIINDENIVHGVDDKEVYCEDLSQYEEWHSTKITKSDGIMYKVVEQMSHDKDSFTQGLTYARGKLFESAGRYGQSSVRIMDRGTADVEKKRKVERLFAEGMTYYKDTLVQITWKAQRGFIYNITDLQKIDTFTYKTTNDEGWGITWDRCNDELIVTDGSANLHFWDPDTMTEKRRVAVKRMDGSDAKEMNEIEFWRGRVLANVWYEDVILVINPETGVVEKEYDFSKLWQKVERRINKADCLNGISISEDPNILYFTGKLWDRMFRIQLLPDL